ncbi:hypothetical protein NEFER03_1104 [Nematocida sp. LUAm3]|nr:hypothetical protein NEFER03_1104 [Nematocida sp. LUAm3]KAI5175291.1 hypothetical protein NEFER02_1220 [Nematocida sp. LUAm2]KAI5177752.1 hypothetical protein NEFER01_0976 [Nematocida sp. LUAm1]
MIEPSVNNTIASPCDSKTKTKRKRSLYINDKTRSRKKLSKEGRLAMQTAKALETMQYGYIELHNSVVDKIYQYLDELKAIEAIDILKIPLDRMFIQKTINHLNKYLETNRNDIIRHMLDIVNIFQHKLDILDRKKQKEPKEDNIYKQKMRKLYTQAKNDINTSCFEKIDKELKEKPNPIKRDKKYFSDFNNYETNIKNLLNNSILQKTKTNNIEKDNYIQKNEDSIWKELDNELLF